MNAPALVLFRGDLRVTDNPALSAAIDSGCPIVAAYIHDANAPHAPGGAARYWLHHALAALDARLRDYGGGLILRHGETNAELDRLIAETGAGSVFWGRRYAPAHVDADTQLKARLTQTGLAVHSHPGRYLFEPWAVRTKTGTPFRVFSPYWRAALALGPVPGALPAPRTIRFADAPPPLPLRALDLLPENPNWAAGFDPLWKPGEAGAQEQLTRFLETGAQGYGNGRDYPAQPHVSRLSPYLQSGDISPRQIWHAIAAAEAAGQMPERDATKYRAELGWREFSAQLLFENPTLPDAPLVEKFRDFPWRDDPAALLAWQKGQTGYPLVDAGMRELWQTGYMHNRVRMVVASFLIKHLRLDWRHGLRWFEDTLVDADAASNAASWQWVAGCGADAAPFFRIFNPTTQAEKFDPEGRYIRQWVPELAELPTKQIFAPGEAPELVRRAAGVQLGQDYPRPMVDHRIARAEALAALEQIS